MQMRKFVLGISLCVAFAALAFVGVVGAAMNGSTYMVNNTADAIDKNPGDDVCATAANVCTLRAAVMEANAHPGTDTIRLQRLAPGSTPDVFKITVGGKDGDTPNAAIGDLDITESVKLSGFNAVWSVIDGNGKDRVFDLHGGTQVELTSMLIQNGNTGDLNFPGGGIYARGTSAALKYVTLDNNKGGVGGGIYNNSGQMSLWRVTVKNNVAGDGWTQGGGVSNAGGLTIDQSTFIGNLAYYGGGLFNEGQTVITNSTFSANRANGDGGGIANLDATGKWIDLSNVTIAFNVADDDNSDSGIGGGIVNLGSGKGSIVVRNSIIAKNVDKTSTDDDDCYGKFNSDGYNLIGHNWQCQGFTATGDKTGGPNAYLDPMLAPLAKNGGTTWTHALQAGSPAIDAGNFNGCQDKNGQLLSYDQRNYQRHIDGDNNVSPWCDIGAYEAGSHYITPTPTTPAVNCNQKPAAPTLQIPTNAAQVTATHVSLDWDGVQCATQYKVLVKMDSKKGVVADRKTVQTSGYITKKLKKGHDYFWRVKACNDAGCTKSVWFSFNIKK